MTKTNTHRAVQNLRNELDIVEFVRVRKVWGKMKMFCVSDNAKLIVDGGQVAFEFEGSEMAAYYVGYYGEQTVHHAGEGRFRVDITAEPNRYCGLTNYELPMAP